MQSEGSEVEVGAVFSDTFEIYRENAGPLLGSAAAVFVVVGLLQAALFSEGGLLLVLVGSIIGLIGTTLYTGFVVKLVEDVRDGRRDFTVNELFSSAAGAIGALIINGILKAIAVAVGLFLLVVPGLILLTIWAVTAPAIVVEGRDGIGAFGRSRELVRGRGWEVFAVIAFAFVITLIVSAVFNAIGAGIGGGGALLLGMLGSILVAPISALVAAILYFQLVAGETQGEAPPPGPLAA